MLARKRTVKTFAEISAALGPERTRLLIAKAEDLGRRLQNTPGTPELGKLLVEEAGADLVGIATYLREQPHHLEAIRQRLGTEWKKEDETSPVDLHEVVVARAAGNTLEPGRTLFIGLSEILALPSAPNGRAVAFATQTELSLHPDSGLCTRVVPVEMPAPAVIATLQGTTGADWTPDSRTAAQDSFPPTSPPPASAHPPVRAQSRAGAVSRRRCPAP